MLNLFGKIRKPCCVLFIRPAGGKLTGDGMFRNGVHGCNHLKTSSLCALGQTAPNPVLSTLRYFRDEYIAHIVDKKCPAGVCKDLLHYKIDPDKCKGCTLCARTCPADAIIGSVREVHMINPEKCVKCGACMEKCRFGAIYKE